MKIKKIVKNKIVIIAFVLCLGIILLSIFWEIEKGKKDIKEESLPKTELETVSEGEKVKFSYSGNLPELVKEAGIFYIKDREKLSESEANQIAAKMGFGSLIKTFEGQQGTSFIYKKENEVLTIFAEKMKFSYSWDILSQTDYPLPQNRLDEIAQNYIKDNFEIGNFSLGQAYFEWIKTDFQGGMTQTDKVEGADFARLSYNLLYEDFPVVEKRGSKKAIVIILTLDGKVKKAEVNLFSQNLEKVGQAELTQSDEALVAINSGLGTITRIDNLRKTYSNQEFESVIEAKLSNVEIVYVFDDEVKLMTPFYRFEGVAETKDGDNAEIEVLIRALPDKVYKE